MTRGSTTPSDYTGTAAARHLRCVKKVCLNFHFQKKEEVAGSPICREQQLFVWPKNSLRVFRMEHPVNISHSSVNVFPHSGAVELGVNNMTQGNKYTEHNSANVKQKENSAGITPAKIAVWCLLVGDDP